MEKLHLRLVVAFAIGACAFALLGRCDLSPAAGVDARAASSRP